MSQNQNGLENLKFSPLCLKSYLTYDLSAQSVKKFFFNSLSISFAYGPKAEAVWPSRPKAKKVLMRCRWEKRIVELINTSLTPIKMKEKAQFAKYRSTKCS